jgi:RNA polymerase sigma-70 factor (sigma-E family)
MFQGPSAEFERFVGEAGPALLRFAHVLTLDRFGAEDLTQDTLIRVGMAWSRVRPDGNPVAYSRRTMVNLFLNGRRRAREAPRGSASEVADTAPRSAPAPGADPAVDRVDDAHLVRDLLLRLPEGQRAAIVLRYLLDLDDAEISGWLGCSEATVRSQISRGLAALRRDQNLRARTEESDHGPR